MARHPAPPEPREPEQRQRLFVAVVLPGSWIASLEAAQRELRDAALPLRFVRPEGIHLTLHFLGATAESRLASLDEALRRATAAARPHGLVLGAPGSFGGPRRPRVVWAGVDGQTGLLQQLHRAIGRELSAAAFPVEQRPFHPHLTLARVPEHTSHSDASRIAAAVENLRLAPVPRLDVANVVLIESHLERGGARYDHLAVHPLTATS